MSRLSGSSVSTGVAAIAGGVVGALLAVVVLLILIIMAIVVIIFKYRNNGFNPKEAKNQGIV